jgi:hypothetical protein
MRSLDMSAAVRKQEKEKMDCVIEYIIRKSSIFFIRRCLRHNVFYKAILNFFRWKKWKSEKL